VIAPWIRRLLRLGDFAFAFLHSVAEGLVFRLIALQSKLNRYREDLEKVVNARMPFLAFVGFFFCLCLQQYRRFVAVQKIPKIIGIPSRLSQESSRKTKPLYYFLPLPSLFLPRNYHISGSLKFVGKTDPTACEVKVFRCKTLTNHAGYLNYRTSACSRLISSHA
jgi:hypothetical protein